MDIVNLISLSILVFISIQMSDSKKLLQLSDVLMSPFSLNSFAGQWTTDTTILMSDENMVLKTLDVTTKQYTIVGKGTYVKDHDADFFILSFDNLWLSLVKDCQQVYRYSMLCNYTVLEIKSGNKSPVAEGKLVQFFGWLENGHSFVYVMDNDAYYQESPNGKAVRLTTTGKIGLIYNGLNDWIYEEEVMSTTQGIASSHNKGKDGKLAYMTIDDSNTPLVHYPVYGYPGSQYVQDLTTSYPKVGIPLPVVTIHVYDLKTQKEIEVPGLAPPAELGSRTDQIMLGMDFVRIDKEDNSIVVTWANRQKTNAIYTKCDLTTLKCEKILQTTEEKGWVDRAHLIWIDTSTFAAVLPQPVDNDGNYKSLTIVSTGMVQKSLTTGKKYVYDIIGYDDKNSLIYFTATDGVNPAGLNFYVVSKDGTTKPETCLSCSVCGYVDSVTMSPDYTYYALSCAGPGPNFASVYTTKENKLIMQLSNNTAVATQMQEFILPEITKLQLDLTDGFKASVWLHCPPGIDKNGKYPLILNGDGFPTNVQHYDTYPIPDFNYYMSTSMGMIVATVVVRGAGGRGDNSRFATYKKIGQDEVYDFINVAKQLIAKFAYIDASRVGFWGENSMGYYAAMVLAKDKENIIKYAISAAPLVRLTYSDAILIEKYMGTYKDNIDGYNKSDITQFTQGIAGKNLLLIATSMNENILFQHAAALARSLQMNGISFEMQTYIDERFPEYGFSDLTVEFHYYNTMVEFWTRHFNLAKSAYTDWVPVPKQ